jgi:hypothetical protein
MKVAILYAGDIRTWNNCRENQLRNIPGEKDLYFHTYSEPENTEYKLYRQAPAWNGVWDDRYKDNKHPWIDTARVLKIWQNLWEGFQMIPQEYDVYVKSRCDIELSGAIDFGRWDIGSGAIVIPTGSDYEDGVNDQFAFGIYAAMEKYFNVYLNHEQMFKDGLRFHTEFYVLKNLERQGVPIHRMLITNSIVR